MKRDIDEVCIALDKQIQTDLIDLKEDTEEVIKAKKEMNVYIDKVKKTDNISRIFDINGLIYSKKQAK